MIQNLKLALSNIVTNN